MKRQKYYNIILTIAFIIVSIISLYYQQINKIDSRGATSRYPRTKSLYEKFIELSNSAHRWLYDISFSGQAAQPVGKLLASDAQIESLYNGTLLGSLENSLNWTHISKKLTESILLGSKSRRELSTFCALGSQNYASALEERLSNEPHENDGACFEQLERLSEFALKLSRTTDKEKKDSGQVAFKLNYYKQFHSFGRLPAGLPHRHHALLGDYDTCASLDSTRYCHGSYGSEQYRIGMCVPRACSSKFLRRSRESMHLLDGIIGANHLTFKSSQQLRDVFCQPAQDSRYMKLNKDWLSRVLLFLPLLWLAVLIYATFFMNNNNDHIMDSFNLLKNWLAFTDTRERDTRLAGLNAIKTICMFYLLAGHYCLNLFSTTINLDDLDSPIERTFVSLLILLSQNIPPGFFIISGLLAGFRYISWNQETGNCEVSPSLNFKKMIIQRYSRLAPMYLLSWLYVRQFAQLLGSGPLWDSGVSTQSQVRQCTRESLWVPLLMLANFKAPTSHCIGVGWHIANDFQIYLVLPLLLLAYRRSRFLGSLVAMGAFIISHLSHVLFWTNSKNYDTDRMLRDIPRFGPHYVLGRVFLDYVNPLGRVGTCFIGVLLADLLLLKTLTLCTQSLCTNNRYKQIVSVLSSNFLLVLGLVMYPTILYLTIGLPLDRILHDSYIKSLIYPTSRLGNEIFWLVILCHLLRHNKSAVRSPAETTTSELPQVSSNGQMLETCASTKFGAFLRLPFWNVLVKLNYVLSLTHFSMIRYIIQSKRELFHFSMSNFAQSLIFISLLCYAQALIIHVTVEIPLTVLVRRLVTKIFSDDKSIQGHRLRLEGKENMTRTTTTINPISRILLNVREKIPDEVEKKKKDC